MRIIIRSLVDQDYAKSRLPYYKRNGASYEVYLKTFWSAQTFYFIESDIPANKPEHSLNHLTIGLNELILYQKPNFEIDGTYQKDKVWIHVPLMEQGVRNITEFMETNRGSLVLLRSD